MKKVYEITCTSGKTYIGEFRDSDKSLETLLKEPYCLIFLSQCLVVDNADEGTTLHDLIRRGDKGLYDQYRNTFDDEKSLRTILSHHVESFRLLRVLE